MRQYKVELTKMMVLKQVVAVKAEDDAGAIKEANLAHCSGNWVTETECPAMGRILSSAAFSEVEKTYEVRVTRKTEEYSHVEIKTTCTAEGVIKDWAIEKAYDEGNWELLGTDDTQAEITEVR
jgi:hypothetical protein